MLVGVVVVVVVVCVCVLGGGGLVGGEANSCKWKNATGYTLQLL